MHKILCKWSQPSLAAGRSLVDLSCSGLSLSGTLDTNDQWNYAHHRTLPCSTSLGLPTAFRTGPLCPEK